MNILTDHRHRHRRRTNRTAASSNRDEKPRTNPPRSMTNNARNETPTDTTAQRGCEKRPASCIKNSQRCFVSRVANPSQRTALHRRPSPRASRDHRKPSRSLHHVSAQHQRQSIRLATERRREPRLQRKATRRDTRLANRLSDQVVAIHRRAKPHNPAAYEELHELFANERTPQEREQTSIGFTRRSSVYARLGPNQSSPRDDS